MSASWPLLNIHQLISVGNTQRKSVGLCVCLHLYISSPCLQHPLRLLGVCVWVVRFGPLAAGVCVYVCVSTLVQDSRLCLALGVGLGR